MTGSKSSEAESFNTKIAGYCAWGHDLSRIANQTGEAENGHWQEDAISCDFPQGGIPKPQDQPEIPGRGYFVPRAGTGGGSWG